MLCDRIRSSSSRGVCLVFATLAFLLPNPAQAQKFVNFESGQVRPLAISPDGTTVFATNTPDNRLEIFDVSGGTLVHSGSVVVGMEPVAVAARSNSEVWVVNHLSDSVSVVDVSSNPPRVTRTLLVGDEPRDMVFAGGGGNVAFISAAHRGQNNPSDPLLTTKSIGRTDVWIFDATNLGAGMGGDEVDVLTFFGDTPRPLATDGDTVWVGVFHSGNRTTALSEGTVCNGGAGVGSCNVGGTLMPGGLPAPNQHAGFVTGPEVGLIVRQNAVTGDWEDELARDWSAAIRFDLPDFDFFGIDATVFPPVASGVEHSGVGTINMNAIVHPTSGKLYVTNTEARNEVRFEGPGAFFGSTSVRGHLHEARITVIDGAAVMPRHLNKHINYAVVPSAPGTKENSLATPLGMAISADGATLYVAAFGSSKIGIFDTTELENDTFVPSSSSHIPVTGGGPTGLVLDEANDRLYALTRFDNSISVIDTISNSEIDHVSIFSPEPASVVDGRPLLYDANETSSNGEASCSSCHIFADFDSLSWDLGNPDEADILNNPLPLRIPVISGFKDFHPLKGPMTTQTLRGMSTHGSMHWRGDRTAGNDPGGNVFDEDGAFKKFNPAFVGLVGRSAELSTSQMQAFADFILTVELPPNPIRALDNSLTTQEQQGRNLFFGRVTDSVFNCDGCHTLSPAQGFFGADGFSTFDGETQSFKVAHMRNMYQKVGMFGMSPTGIVSGSFPHTGPQVRASGFLHDGSVDTVFRFLSSPLFSINDIEQRSLEAFSLAFDTDHKPIVGQQITLADSSALAVDTRISLMIARAAVGECDVVVKGTIAGEGRGAVRLPGGNFQMDRQGQILGDATLRAEAQTAGQELTYTCVPPGSGTRVGVDRDEDGFFDRDEIDAGSDPADSGSTPPAPTPTPSPTPTPTATPPAAEAPIRATTFQLRDDATPPITANKRRLSFKSTKKGALPSGVEAAPWGSDGDPTVGGSGGGSAVVTVYKVGGALTDVMTLTLPASNWQRTGNPGTPGYKYLDKNGVHGPITTVKVIQGKLTVKGKGNGLYELLNAPQDEMGIRLQLGTGDIWCSAATARDPEFKFDNTVRFFGEKQTPAPAVCPAVPAPPPGAYGSASWAFVTRTGSLLK
ncbi:MAG: hypothetical protein P8R42_02425 [Candidatus Binatia bacterium]|nr:hypothetical protein [Candidatus Binatia bacterium]